MPKGIRNEQPTGAGTTEAPVKRMQQKAFVFQLYPVNESAIPIDEKNIKREPYPAIWQAESSGLAIDKDGNLQEWRYVHAFQKSIWVKDQKDVPDIHLNDPRNDLTFKRGKLVVQAFETAKLQALKIQDKFSGNTNPVKPGSPKMYFLVDQEAHNQQVKDLLDDAFEAEKRAREMHEDDLYSMASLFGIDVEQTTTSIRTQLIIKAKEVPKAFLREHLDPKTKIRYLFLQALQQDVISTSQIPGQIVWVDTKVVMCDVRPTVDAVEELTMRWVAGDAKVHNLAEKLKELVLEE